MPNLDVNFIGAVNSLSAGGCILFVDSPIVNEDLPWPFLWKYPNPVSGLQAHKIKPNIAFTAALEDTRCLYSEMYSSLIAGCKCTSFDSGLHTRKVYKKKTWDHCRLLHVGQSFLRFWEF
jgi:hypothetical protein